MGGEGRTRVKIRIRRESSVERTSSTKPPNARPYSVYPYGFRSPPAISHLTASHCRALEPNLHNATQVGEQQYGYAHECACPRSRIIYAGVVDDGRVNGRTGLLFLSRRALSAFIFLSRRLLVRRRRPLHLPHANQFRLPFYYIYFHGPFPRTTPRASFTRFHSVALRAYDTYIYIHTRVRRFLGSKRVRAG